MEDDESRFEVSTLIGHRRRDGTLRSVAVTVDVRDRSESARTRVHYAVDGGLARLHHFVVGDEFATFEVEDLGCVPIAERAITSVPGVEEVEPAETTLTRAVGRGDPEEGGVDGDGGGPADQDEFPGDESDPSGGG
jgi:hypothetical protein